MFWSNIVFIWLFSSCFILSFVVFASSTSSDDNDVKDKVDNNVIYIIVALVILFVVTIIIIVAISLWQMKNLQAKRPENRRIEIVHQPSAQNTGVREPPFGTATQERRRDGQNSLHYEINPISTWWEIQPEKLKIHGNTVLGSGQFGVILLGEVIQNGQEKKCAVKTLKAEATEQEKKSLRNELQCMSDMDSHPNIVNLIGAQTKNGNFLVVVEYCSNGDLHTYLKKSRSDPDSGTNISYVTRLRIAFDIANGMNYLSTKGFIHRDLAARNVLLDADMRAKVSDFGRTRDIRETFKIFESLRGRKEPIPTRWMPVETLRSQIFTTQSDVWSYGVLLWEIESGGVRPYDCDQTYREVMDRVVYQGYRLEQPSFCPDVIYEIMVKCWKIDPSERPSFGELAVTLGNMLKDSLPPKYSTLPPQDTSDA